MNFHPGFVFLVGLVVIIIGAELVLRGGARIAAMLGVKPIIIGLTVVSIGTSMPELAVGITAASEGMGSLAVGNIAGTNMFNILFILGLSAAIRPLPLQLLSIRLDVPVMIASAVVLIPMAYNGVLSVNEGIILVLAAIVYTIVLVRLSRRETIAAHDEFDKEFSKSALLNKTSVAAGIGNVLMLVSGMAMTVVGANLLVDGSVSIATELGVSEAVIGLTIVAVGTSAPELVTTIVATIRNDRDIAVGNLIGSSISNILFILGVTCVVSGEGVDVSRDILQFDLPLAAGVAIACYPVFRSGRMVSRTEGIVFVSLYFAYMILLFARM